MMLLGRKIAKEIEDELRARADKKSLLVIQVGSDEVSSLYVKKKKEFCQRIGVRFNLKQFSYDVTQFELIKFIKKANVDESIDGIIIQLPLPDNIDKNSVLLAISSDKDIDGFRYILDKEYKHYPPTVLAIDRLIDHYALQAKKTKVLIVGGGFLVGGPLCKYWLDQGIEVEILDKSDGEYFKKIKSAGLVVVSTGGRINLGSDNFAKNAVVIDASTVSESGSVKGDIDKTGWPENISLAPVPGGVGPLTVAMLVKNLYE
jgi:methylenetetrahydrofolate dehydrogenase (NADP+)/methenyltetrahydrofolate cyclohydrolase